MKIKTIVITAVLGLFLLILLIPAVQLAVKLVNEKENYALEIVNDQELLLKYQYQPTADGSPLDIVKNFFNSTNQEITSQEKISLNNNNEIYFDEIDQQYQLIGDSSGLISDEGFVESANSDNTGSVAFDQQQILIEKQDVKILSQFKNAKVIHDFDGSGIVDDSNDYSLKLPENTDYETPYLDEFVNKDYQKPDPPKYQHSINAFQLLPVNNFFTSPKPSSKNDNTWEQLNNLKLILDKEGYYRFEVIRINLVSEDTIDISDLKIFMKRGDYLIPNVGGLHDAFFRYQDGTIYSSYAMGYNPPSGDYEILVKSISKPEWEGITKSFKILRRVHPPLEKGFSVVNWEYGINIKSFDFTGPYGKKGGVEQLAKWLSYMGVDAFWILGGQTTGWDKNVTPDTPWGSDITLKNLNLLTAAAKKEGVKTGAYVMSFFTPANGKIAAGYINSLGYNKGSIHDSLHISLMDKRRIQNIVDRMITFENDPNVDFVGLDFIRTGRADGYEMGPLVIKDMNITTPKNYANYSIEDKVKWFARNVENQKNQVMIKKWRWWRAHRVATIANQVINDAKLTKPMWVFTLGWEHGSQHGQDPYMFFDAGVFADAAMLYEANYIQFRNMMVQWPNYMTYNKNNLIIGNASDLKFLDGEMGSYGLEYLRRTKTAYTKIYREGLAKGIFIHDLSRALWSKRRYYTIGEWALLHGHATSEFKKDHGLIPYEGEISFDQTSSSARELTGKMIIKNISKQNLNNLQVEYAPTGAYDLVFDNVPENIALSVGESISFSFKARLKEKYIGMERPFGYKITHANFPKYFFMTFNFNRNKTFITEVKSIL